MYYQVGNKCLERFQAENVYFSLVVPRITEDGRLLKPEYTGKSWQLNGETVQASLPQCSPAENVAEGLELGWLLFGVMASVYFVMVLKKLFV